MPSVVDANCFLAVIRPALASGDAESLAHLVRAQWSPSDISQLMIESGAHARCAAALVLGLIGSMEDAPALAVALKDEDVEVSTMAEHALWSIWFRACSSSASEPFRQGTTLIASQSYAPAVACFDRAIEADPSFAEAYHQRAIAYFFLSQWECAVADCSRTVRRVPMHFAAVVDMGHCHIHRRDFSRALRCYRHALRIHPRLSEIADVVARLESPIGQTDRTDCLEAARITV